MSLWESCPMWHFSFSFDNWDDTPKLSTLHSISSSERLYNRGRQYSNWIRSSEQVCWNHHHDCFGKSEWLLFPTLSNECDRGRGQSFSQHQFYLCGNRFLHQHAEAGLSQNRYRKPYKCHQFPGETERGQLSLFNPYPEEGLWLDSF